MALGGGSEIDQVRSDGLCLDDSSAVNNSVYSHKENEKESHNEEQEHQRDGNCDETREVEQRLDVVGNIFSGGEDLQLLSHDIQEDDEDVEDEDDEDEDDEDDEDEDEDEDYEDDEDDEDEFGFSRGTDDVAILANSILTDIKNGTYTCLVCTGEIDSDSKIWSCDVCYRTYDLDCIRSWATKGSSTLKSDRSWRCPSCNNKHFKIPKSYTCWCKKIMNPPANPIYPHSCSNTCNHKLEGCSHGCSFPCHPGPHVKRCGAIGPVMKCHCGKNEKQLPCVITPYKTGWCCYEPCGDIMPCGIHKCQQTCHTGPCGVCKEVIVGKCYCGKHQKDMFCYQRIPKKSINKDGNSWIGVYQCEEICNELLDCGNHRCEKTCHALDPANDHKCLLKPELASHCYCGKQQISSILNGQHRKSCLDPIPSCDQICGKLLTCGHKCVWKCHPGECSPCYQILTESCSCQYSQFSVPCKFVLDKGKPRCHHKCQALLNCRRHRCNRQCCSYEQVAMKRERERKKQIRKNTLNTNSFENDTMTIEAVHICTRECGKLLACGIHYCKMSCHVGPCNPCLESSAEDLICSCGNTVVPAPVRCGTKLPPCPYPCTRQPACDHRLEQHNCHENDQECPKCTKLLTKTCQCDKKIEVKNVMCFQQHVSCGLVCGKPLKCGHKCLKTCHKPGECQTKCTSKCGAAKSVCGHLDDKKCHYPSPCNEKLPCSTMVVLRCKCNRIKRELPCGATLTKPSIENNVLDCDDECARVERNKQLFQALNISSSEKNAQSSIDIRKTSLPDNLICKLLELENPYAKDILMTYFRQKTWCLEIEKKLRNLLISSEPSRRTLHFQPMKKAQRQFIHNLAAVYGFYSESHDPEPRRSVTITKLLNSKTPSMTLEEGYICYSKLKERENLRAFKKEMDAKELVDLNGNFDLKHSYYNAIAIRDVFFGVTRDEIESCLIDLVEAFMKKPGVVLSKPININYINDSTYVFYGNHHNLTSQKLENELYTLSTSFLSLLRQKSLAFDCKLCKLDESGSVIYDTEDNESRNRRVNGNKAENPKTASENLFTVLDIHDTNVTKENNEELTNNSDQQNLSNGNHNESQSYNWW